MLFKKTKNKLTSVSQKWIQKAQSNIVAFKSKMSFLLNLWACGTIVSSFCGANYLVYKGIKYSKEQKIEYTDLFEETLVGFTTGMLFGLFLPFYFVVRVITFPAYIAEKIKK